METVMQPHATRGRSRLLLLAATAAATALALAGCTSTSAEGEDSGSGDRLFDQSLHDLLPKAIQDSGTLTMGGLWETPPVLYVSETDPTKPVGLAPEMAELIGETLGVDIEWQNLAWPAQIPGLQAGSVDALFGQVSISAEREEGILDLVPYQKRGHALLVAAGNAENIHSIADLCGLTVGVPIGSNQAAKVAEVNEAECIGEGKDAIKTADYQGAAAAVQALRAGTIDAWLDVSLNVQATVDADPDVFAAAEVPQGEMPTEFSGIAVAKENPGLSEALVGAMKLLIENGSYKQIYSDRDQELSMLELDEVVVNPLTGTPAGEMAG